MTIDENLKVVLSKRLRAYFLQAALESNFVPYDGVAIRLPERLAEPSPDFLRYHREMIFHPDLKADLLPQRSDFLLLTKKA